MGTNNGIQLETRRMDEWAGRRNGEASLLEEQNIKGKEWRKTETKLSGPSGTMYKHANIPAIGVSEGRREKESQWENFEEIIVENLPTMEKTYPPAPRSEEFHTG